jgi:hypothetical protein
MNRSIYIAYAVNSYGNFEEKHFGNAERHHIYKWTEN